MGASSAVIFEAILNKTPTPPVRLNPELPPALERIIDKALEKDREERYQSAKELLVDLRRLKREVDSGRSSAASVIPRATLPRPWWRGRSALGGLTVAVTLAIAGAALHYVSRRSNSESSLPPMRTLPFTSLPGQESAPTFSPDGNQVAFIWNDEQGNEDLYVKLVGAGTPLRLTTSPASERQPAWSPDGRYIAFGRVSPDGSGIFIIPALGGPERRIDTLTWNDEWDRDDLGISWSPDGKFLAFSDRSEPQGPARVFVVSVDSSTRRTLTSPPAKSRGDVDPAISPDGRTVAFRRVTSGGSVSDIHVVPFSGGEPRRVTFLASWLGRVAWTADGRELLFASGGPTASSLWRVSASEGQPARLPVAGEHVMSPAVSSRGNRLAYVQGSADSNIWRLDIRKPTQSVITVTKSIASTRHEAGPQFSPDGRRIVFHSDRSGTYEIWVCDADGRNQVQVTSLEHSLSGTPRWSPDGRHIAFDSQTGEDADIFVIDADGGRPRRVTTEPSADSVPSWSNDGRSIYFTSNRSGRWEIWKVAAEGGQAIQLTKQGGFAAFESRDGRSVYYAKGLDQSGLWKVPVSGGNEVPVLEFPKPGYWGYWALTAKGIFYVNTGVRPNTLEFFDFATRHASRIANLDKEPTAFEPGLAVSADERTILYVQQDQINSDIILVENFQ